MVGLWRPARSRTGFAAIDSIICTRADPAPIKNATTSRTAGAEPVGVSGRFVGRPAFSPLISSPHSSIPGSDLEGRRTSVADVLGAREAPQRQPRFGREAV